MTDTIIQVLKIDPEFRYLIPPLSDDEYQRLEDSLIKNGYQDWREPIITWNGTIIDGHNRYAICDEYGIKFKQMEMQFESREAAKIYIIENQFKRRNLKPYDRSVLALQLEPLYAAEAKRRLSPGTNQYTKRSSQNSDETSDDSEEGGKSYHLRTDEQLAKLAGTSRDTIRKVKVIETEAAKGNQTAIDAREAVKSGEKSINKAYSEIRPKICTICGKPILNGDYYEHDQNKHKACASTETELNRGKRGGRKANRVLTKPQYADDGRRICSTCGEPIDEGDAYDHHPWLHKACFNKNTIDARRRRHEAENITIGDVNEVIEHDKAELKRHLMLDVGSALSNLQATLDRYESMGVAVTEDESKRIRDAIDPLVKAIQSIAE